MNAADQQLAQGAPEVGIEFDAVVVGAGFGGMYMLHCLRQNGLPRASTRQAATSAGPGTGTAIRVRDATSKACSILIRFRKN